MPAPARLAALTALRSITAERSDLPAALARARRGLRDERDRALAAEIVTGTLRTLAALDHLIAHFARRPVARLDAGVRDVLRLSAYQLIHLERVPARAVVNEAVELTKGLGQPRAAGLVNAVLRALARDRSHLPLPKPPVGIEPFPRAEALEYLSVTLSHPRWLVTRWLDRYGFEAAHAWTRFNNTPAPLTLRVNGLRTTAAELVAQLAAHDVEVEPARRAPDGLVVRRGHPLSTPLAGSGLFVVQDEASQLVAVFAGARPGERVLDLCAAPGNKTLALASALGGRGLLVAADLRSRRLRLLAATLAQGGLSHPRIVQSDARRPLPFRATFDLVLLDAPCSGLGTIRRDPDIRWRRAPDDLAGFAAAQVRMLEQAAPVVAAGGRIVYATCSSEPEENDDVVDRFLERHPDFRLVDPAEALGAISPAIRPVLDARGCLRTRPWVDELEAFFAAMLVKVKRL